MTPTLLPEPPEARVRRRRRILPRDLAFLLAIVVGLHWIQTRHVPAGQAPAFLAPLADGGRMDLAGWRARHAGKPALIYFWAEWCAVCRAQRDVIEAIRADWPVLTVATRSGDPAAVRHYLLTAGLDWETAVDSDGTLTASYGLRGVPALLVVGPGGEVRAASVGYTPTWSLRLRLWWAALLG